MIIFNGREVNPLSLEGVALILLASLIMAIIFTLLLPFLILAGIISGMVLPISWMAIVVGDKYIK